MITQNIFWSCFEFFVYVIIRLPFHRNSAKVFFLTSVIQGQKIRQITIKKVDRRSQGQVSGNRPFYTELIKW